MLVCEMINHFCLAWLWHYVKVRVQCLLTVSKLGMAAAAGSWCSVPRMCKDCCGSKGQRMLYVCLLQTLLPGLALAACQACGMKAVRGHHLSGGNA
jgi:hypothetical protein